MLDREVDANEEKRLMGKAKRASQRVGASHSELALLGGPKAVQRGSPAWPVVDEIDVSHMEAVVRSGQWSWVGPHETAFLREWAGFLGCKYAMCVANGTVSMEIALQALGVKPGDEVIVPGMTWVATLQAPLTIGANAVVVDVDPETYCIDPKAIEKAITPRTRAIIPVHLYGCMCDMDAIMAIAQKHGLKVVEDAAHQQGSAWKGKRAGAIGDAGSFSFQQSKVLTCGEGGSVVFRDDEQAYRTAFALKHVGWLPEMSPGEVYGHNFRITEMQAVLLRGGLRRLPEQTRIREENVAYLRERLDSIGGPLRIAKRDPRVTIQAYYCLSMHYDKRKFGNLPRALFLEPLSHEGWSMGGPYAPVYRHPLLNLYHPTSPVPYRPKEQRIQDYRSLRLPVTERVFEEEGVFMGHTALLGGRQLMDEFILAYEKVLNNQTAIRRYYQEKERQQAKA